MSFILKQPSWFWVLVILFFVFVISSFLYKYYIKSIEGGEYEVLEKKKDYEIRQYKPFLVAETDIQESDMRVGGNQAFSVLAGYIFGNNVSKEKIAMTSPVLDEVKSEKIAMTSPVLDEVGFGGNRVISFLLPSKYTLDTLPVPQDDRVRLREIPARKMAVTSFGGFWSEKNFTKHYNKLTKALSGDGIKFQEGFTRASYDPPITPPFLRRNEILVEPY